MAESEENPVSAIALESRLAEEAGHSDASTAKPIARKKKSTRKRQHGESTESRYLDTVAILNQINGHGSLPFNVIVRKSLQQAKTISII